MVRSSFAFILLAASALAEDPLHLKARRAQAEGEWKAKLAEPVQRRASWRSHFIVQFGEPPRPEQLEELKRRGANVLQYVPDFGFMVSAQDHIGLEDLGLRWAGRLRPEDKVSPALQNEEEPSEFFVVEFFPGVGGHEVRELAVDQGFEVLGHPDLLPNQLVLRGKAGRLRRLAEWDEIAYVFLASEELAGGSRVRACAGALTGYGPVGQYVAKVGEGWDGPGRNSAQLGYFFETLTDKLPHDQVREEILRAMREWAKYASLSFLPVGGPRQPRTLNVLFAAGWHEDPWPFDGPSGVLAHTFYPSPPNPEPIAGDMHFDDDEEWVIGPDRTMFSIDLFTVALHEVGHALGLGHSDIPGTVMYPYYRRMSGLSEVDIAAILELYAAAEETALHLLIQSPSAFPLTTPAAEIALSGTVTGGSGDVEVEWRTDRGATGTAQGGRSWVISGVPLLYGSNEITLTASDAGGRVASQAVVVTRQAGREAPLIRITSPAAGGSYSTAASSVTVAGTATHPAGIQQVVWTNSRGGSGTASGTEHWNTGHVPLETGSNQITVTAREPDGGSASASILVTRTAAVTNDTVAPQLRITSPSSTNVATRLASIVVRGTASDNVGVTSVTWSTPVGYSGVATGTETWITGEIPLLVGTNTIVIRAHDAAGNSSWRSLTVTRR